MDFQFSLPYPCVDFSGFLCRDGVVLLCLFRFPFSFYETIVCVKLRKKDVRYLLRHIRTTSSINGSNLWINESNRWIINGRTHSLYSLFRRYVGIIDKQSTTPLDSIRLEIATDEAVSRHCRPTTRNAMQCNGYSFLSECSFCCHSSVQYNVRYQWKNRL
mmetsp:Transcript_26038/g.57059  ORF Transcript_26038/g.57059 Transcript_26038/m.57059 type:complete len:160 (-) Transcript_26038:19-498(-)